MNRVLIIGCGLIGSKRAAALPEDCDIVGFVDPSRDRAEALASKYGGVVFLDWNQALQNDVDVVIVSAYHSVLAYITKTAVLKGAHVLVEKPAAVSSLQLEDLITARDETNSIVHVGFNHRFHRAMLKARQLVTSGALGDLMYVRGRYGHGGRVGYEKEWRSIPHLSGGGELIDQGAHLIDLARWFLGDFEEVNGIAKTFFWEAPVDDNGFLLLQTKSGEVAFLHASSTEWKNTFSFEIYGKKGKIEISGLGGSYGVEKITHYKMSDAMGPPETFIWEYPMVDNSWEVELQSFFNDIRTGTQTGPGLVDALMAMKVIEKITKESGYDYSS